MTKKKSVKSKARKPLLALGYWDLQLDCTPEEIEDAGGVTFTEAEWRRFIFYCNNYRSGYRWVASDTPLSADQKKQLEKVERSTLGAAASLRNLSPLMLNSLLRQLNPEFLKSTSDETFQWRAFLGNAKTRFPQVAEAARAILKSSEFQKKGSKEQFGTGKFVNDLRKLHRQAKGRLSAPDKRKANFTDFLECLFEAMPSALKRRLKSVDAALQAEKLFLAKQKS